MKKKNEIGRSMVEILGVLAIMGVLTIGGIAGYVYAIQKSKANTITAEVTKRAIIASYQLAIAETDVLDLSEFYPDSDHDEIAGFETETYVMLPKKEHFAVDVNGVSGGVCSRILEMDWSEPVDILVDGTSKDFSLDGSCEEGLHLMTFVFDKGLNGNIPYSQCEVDSDCTALVGAGYLCDQDIKKCYRYNEQNLIYDRDGRSYPCDTNAAVRTANQDACTGVCGNREWMYDTSIGEGRRWGYCIPKCRAGEFPKRTSIGDPDTVKCMACDDPGGNDSYGTIGKAMCEGKCPGRYTFQTGYTRNNVCLTNNCPEGKYRCYSGCCACNNAKAQSLCHWYTQDCNAAGAGQLVPNGKDACLSCSDSTMGEREVTSRGWCRVKNCPEGYFRNGNDCISCSDTSSITINPTGNTAPCLSCKDEEGNFIRAVDKNYCVLKTKCSNEQPPNNAGFCGDCPDGYFTYNGTCIACDDDKAYKNALASECNKCDGKKGHKRIMKNIYDGGGTPPHCLRERTDNEFYITSGTKSCDDTITPLSNRDDCLACGSKRLYIGNNACVLNLPDGYWGVESNSFVFVHCNDSKAVSFTSGNVSSSCSAACPGQRYVDNSNGGRCSKCPNGSYANTTTSCTTCPEDKSTLTTKGACVVCGGSWNNGKCDGDCPDGFYYNEKSECVACPMNLVFSGSFVSQQFQCQTCHGTWSSSTNTCVTCPTEITEGECSALNSSRCDTCGCGWDDIEKSCFACPADNTENTTRGRCEGCGGTWTVKTGIGSCK